VKRILFTIVGVLLAYSSYSSPETIAISINSWSEDFNKQSTYKELSQIEAFFNSMLLDLGYKVVERSGVSTLFEEYEDQTREDYLDGKTVRIKLHGARDYLFIDVVEKGASDLLVYYSLTDVFNENILFVGKIQLDKNNVLSNLESNKMELLEPFYKSVGINLYYYSFDMKKTLKLISKSRSNLETGTVVHVRNKHNKESIGSLKVTKQLSSNMVECTVLDYDKKSHGKLSEFDFSEFDFYTSNEIVETTSSDIPLTVNLLPSNCFDAGYYFECMLMLESVVRLESGLHLNRIRFEQNLQSNELFMEGKSFYKDKLLGLNNVDCVVKKNDSDDCSLVILRNNSIELNESVSTPENVVVSIKNYLNN
jgi:hypothetical protein